VKNNLLRKKERKELMLQETRKTKKEIKNGGNTRAPGIAPVKDRSSSINRVVKKYNEKKLPQREQEKEKKKET
jgi:hypothetical protein